MSKESTYTTLLQQIQSVLRDETDTIARMANVAAMLQEAFRFWWTGFYRVIDNQLVLGPFQGPLACMRINYGRGVCGTAWQRGETIIVGNVHEFPGHIACSSESKSEIVVPIIRNGKVTAVLDIDSEHFNTFDSTDQQFIEQIVKLI